MLYDPPFAIELFVMSKPCHFPALYGKSKSPHFSLAIPTLRLPHRWGTVGMVTMVTNEPPRGKPNNVVFRNRSDTNRPVQAQKTARSLKHWIKEEEILYYPYSENKGADHGLGLCFRQCRLLVFPWDGSNDWCIMCSFSM